MPIGSGITFAGADISFSHPGVYRITLGFRAGGGSDVWTGVRLYGDGLSRGTSNGFGKIATADPSQFQVSFLAQVLNTAQTYQIQIGRLGSSLDVVATADISGHVLPSLQATIEKID